MLVVWILQRPHGHVEDVTGHFPIFRSRIEAAELDGLNALLVLELVEVTLVDRWSPI